ncbi:MAG: gamma-glutamyltransferase family protein [Rhodobacteraceae bacterium]|nr:gamma-glutamyltransferase family protein [Paracoccaceae bacterium]
MRDFHLPGRSAVFATNGMCATSHPLAAQVAIEVLKDGGNAVDAAIAGAVLLGLCEPQMTGIGGDCFVLFTPPGEDRVLALNGSGRAPAAISAQALRDAGHATVSLGSADAVTVPGAIDAFCRLSQDWGRSGLAASLAPAIHYADAGIPVAPRVALDWGLFAGNLQGIARDQYLLNGAAPTTGQVFRAPGQAEVLRRIARDGRAAFYEGEVAEDMVNSLQTAGGCHTLDDFANTACDYTDPISGTYGGHELVEHPPNGHGATAILLGNMLKHFDIAGMDPFGTERAHIEIEAAKLAYDARDRIIADPDHTSRLEHMLDPATAEALAALVDPARARQNVAQITEEVHRETIYITVVDKDRMAVSLIYSVFKDFGSGIASDKFGVLFQNRGAGFNLTPGHPNEIGPGKRPLHTIIPAMLRKDGRVVMPFGVMGGGYQPNGHIRFLSNMFDFGMDPQSAIDGPRCFFEKGDLRVERGYSDAVRADLAAMGHKVVVPPRPIGGAQAITINHDTGVLEGASDPRKDGCALGY